MGTQRILVLVAAYSVGGAVSAQPEFQIYGGGQLDHLQYELLHDGPSGDPHASSRVEFERGSGWGWHVQAGFLSGPELIEFKIALALSRMRAVSAYERSSSYHALGGGSSSEWTGEYDDRFTTIEMPLQISIAVHRTVRLDIGCAPWLLVGADHRDRGTTTSSWWVMTQGSGASSSTYDERSRDMQPYSQYGLSGILGVSCTIKKHLLASVSTNVQFTPIYLKGDPYTGHHSVFRLSLGYGFTAWR